MSDISRDGIPRGKILRLSAPSHGWMEVIFEQSPERLVLYISDAVNDGLAELAEAVARLLNGSTEEVVEFCLEPDYATCRLQREEKTVRISVYLPEVEAPLFKGTEPLRSFADGLRESLLDLEPCWSDDTAWTYPFPHGEVALLKNPPGTETGSKLKADQEG